MFDIQIPISDRITFLYAEYGSLELDGNAVVLRQGDSFIHFPVGAAAVIVLMPGTVVTHAAVKACADEKCLLLWMGEHGVRCYSAGNPGRDGNSLLRQVSTFLSDHHRLSVARKIFQYMFDEEAPASRSIDQLRGMEGARVRALYPFLAKQYGLEWEGRDQRNSLSTPLNQAISAANAALYGLVEGVILTLGYAPSIGFVHSGDSRSFVFDVADCIKFKTVVPLAMMIYAESKDDLEGRIRRASRDMFSKERMAGRIVSILDDLLTHG